MKSRTLYVIGNGFDLWHGIPLKLGPVQAVRPSHRPRRLPRDREVPPHTGGLERPGACLGQHGRGCPIDNLGHFMASYGAEDWSDSGHHDFQYEVQNVTERLSRGMQQSLTGGTG